MVVEQIVSGLDSGVADGGLGIGDTRKILKEMAGQLDDRAVLDQHPAVIAKQRRRLGRRQSLPGDLLADHLFQQPLQDVFKRLVKAEADGLPGGGGARQRLQLGGQIVATGRALKPFGANGCEQTEDINFSGGALGEFQIFGELEQVWPGEKDGADGELFRGGGRCGRCRHLF